MSTRTRIVALVAALAALAALPAVASAKTVPLRGVVSGSPYGASNGQMAIPVLFSKMSARASGLKSPVGVVILGRSQHVKLPNGGGYSLPVNLRNGDRFKGLGQIGSIQRRTFYPRVVLSKNVAVYFRSKELSMGELTAAVGGLQKALTKLQSQVNILQAGSIKAFQDIYSQLADLKKALSALQALKLPDFQATIDALSSKLDALIAGLPDFTKFALVSQLPDLTQYVKLSDLPSLLGSSSLITTLQSQVGTLQGQVGTLQGQVTTLTSRLNAVCSAVKAATVTVGGVPLPVSLPGITSVGACGP